MSQTMKSSSPLDAVRDLFGDAADAKAVPEWPSSTEPMPTSINTPLQRPSWHRSNSPEIDIASKLLEVTKMMDVMMNEMAEIKKELTAAKTAPAAAAARMDPMQQPDTDAWAAYRISMASGQGVATTAPPGYPSAGAGAIVPVS